MVQKDATIQIDTYYWRSEDVEKRDLPRQSTMHWMIMKMMMMEKRVEYLVAIRI